jgi:hypothetical protein
MNITFGFITSNTSNLLESINSIIDLGIPESNFEVIIVGGINIFSHLTFINHIDFDENIKSAWITRKKNIIVENAKFENIVMCHDYIKFEKDWYEGFLNFGNNWDWCICKIKNKDGTRYRDYTFFPYYPWWNDINNKCNDKCLIPYDYPNNLKMNKFIYVSGAFYIIKKNIAIKYLLDENRIWGQGEDVILSMNLLNNNIILKCNPNSTVSFLKYHSQPQSYFNTESSVDELNKFNEELNNLSSNYFLKNFEYSF